MNDATYTTQTTNGHEISCHAWQASGKINFSLTIDGSQYDTGTSDDDRGRSTAETEAKHQADTLANSISSAKVRTVRVFDAGGWAEFEINEVGALRVIQPGGCDVQSILGGMMAIRLSDDELAEAILEAWEKEYDGDAAENGLRVEVDAIVRASA